MHKYSKYILVIAVISSKYYISNDSSILYSN